MPKKPIRSPCFARLTVFSLFVFLAGCASPPPPASSPSAGNPAAPAAFALLGDTPYSEGEARRLDSLIDALNREQLAFVAHIGDITSGRGPCTDEWFEQRKAQFARVKHPFVLLPGDNDWVDCLRSGMDPMERLAKWRQLFCFQEKIKNIERQPGEYCEHVRWEFEGVLFVALNVQGSNNNLGRTRAMDAEHAARSKVAIAWIEASEQAFRRRNLKGMVLLMQANPFLKPRSGGRNGYEGTLEKLQALGIAHPRRVALVHGDTHTFRDDYPLPGLHRVEVPGSPFVSWLRSSVPDGQLRVEHGGQH